MNLQGLTSEFSLPELFKFLQESQQSGRLSLKPVEGSSPVKKAEGKAYFFWFEKGNLLAASNRLDGLGLLSILQERSLIQSATLPRLLRQCPPKVALGKFLKDRAVLTGKQLPSLFASQVLRHTCVLLKATDVRFAFSASYPIPYLEMTGVRIRATDITLPSLRILKDWGALTEKLPGLESGLKPVGGDLPAYRLHSQEKDVLRLAQEGMSLSKISKVLKLPTLDIRKTAFRLIYVGLVKEVPLMQFARPAHQPRKRISTKISEAFLGRLSGYLQQIPSLTQTEHQVPVTANIISSSSTSSSHRQAVNPDKTARNSAIKRIIDVISIDRSERIYEMAPSCLVNRYPSCLLTRYPSCSLTNSLVHA